MNKEHQRGFHAGMAVAAAICVKSHGEEVIAQEILEAAAMDTRAKAKRMGADDYDLKILAPVFRHMRDTR